MIEPEYVITLKDGKQYITITDAALMLGINRRRVLQFIELGKLSAATLPRSKDRIIPLDEFRKFAATPRPTGRPSIKKKAAKKAVKKGK